MKKTKFTGVALASLLVVGLAACGENPASTSVAPTSQPTTAQQTTTEEQPTQQEGPSIKEAVEINFWNTKGSPYDSVIDQAIESFKLVEPNVTVNNVKQSVGISQMQGVVTKGFTSNVYPDIVEGYPDHFSTYMDYDKVVQLDEYIDHPVYGLTAEEKADFVESYMKEGTEYLTAGTWSLPFSKSSEVLLYNKDILTSIDLSAIDSSINEGRPLSEKYLRNLSWAEFFGKLCPALMTYNEQAKEDEKILDTSLPQYGILGYDSDDNLAITLTQQYGIPYTAVDTQAGKGQILFNNPQMKEKLHWINEAAAKHYIITQGSLGTYTNSLLATNGVLFVVSSTAGLSHCTVEGSEMAAGMIPQPTLANENEANKIISQGPSICFLTHEGIESEANAKNRILASWLFYKHLTNYDNGLSWATNGSYFPIKHSVLEGDEYVDYLEQSLTAAKDSASHLTAAVNKLFAEKDNSGKLFTEYFYSTPAFKGSADARTNIGGALTKAIQAGLEGTIADDATVQEWLTYAYDQTILAMAS